jgi:hypothetical protein
LRRAEMGLDFDHGDAHWSYRGFGRFRKRLAEAIGVRLEEMRGFGGGKSWDTVQDDIVPLLNHSDCDGELTPEECAKVAPRLSKLAEAWDEDDYDRITSVELVAAMLQCAEDGVALGFC